jgi:excisionase family DNA binding protein
MSIPSTNPAQDPPSAEVDRDLSFLVKPRTACRMLACGNTRLYELLAAGELDSFLDGRSRKITFESIRRYVARRLNQKEAKAA